MRDLSYCTASAASGVASNMSRTRSRSLRNRRSSSSTRMRRWPKYSDSRIARAVAIPRFTNPSDAFRLSNGQSSFGNESSTVASCGSGEVITHWNTPEAMMPTRSSSARIASYLPFMPVWWKQYMRSNCRPHHAAILESACVPIPLPSISFYSRFR